MAKIPTTNVSMSALQNEYGGGNPINMSEYYRNTNNTQLVKNSAVIPANPIALLDTSYTPVIPNTNGYGGSTSYARKTTIIRYADGPNAFEYVPNTDINRIWVYQGNLVAQETTQNDPGSNRPAPNSFYGNDAAFFYFTPDTPFPFVSGRTVESMFVQQVRTPFVVFGVNLIQFENWYALWRSLGTAAYTGFYNQTVPTSGTISLGNFKNQENP